MKIISADEQTFVDQQNGYDSRYTFSAKEKDDETQYSYFGARYYDSDLSVWLSVDPLSDSFPAWSSYNYCFQNPMRFLDPNGEGPGDLFESIDDAAIDFGKTYNDNSIQEGREYMSTIYKVKDEEGNTKYSYTVPNVGNEEGGCKPSKGDTKKRDRVAAVHTHGDYRQDLDALSEGKADYDGNEVFSYQDEMYAQHRGYPFYVVTPGGRLRKYDPKVHYPEEFSEISDQMPSDPYSPHRTNTIDPAPLPKNEQINDVKKKRQ